MDNPAVTITDVDRSRLGTLLTCVTQAAYGRPHARFDLETKLEGASVVPAAHTPRTLVTMNSTVELVDVDTQELQTRTLAYPEDRDLIPHSVVVLQSLGRRILGRSVGDVVRLKEGNRVRRYRIESIPYQPEAVGASHL